MFRGSIRTLCKPRSCTRYISTTSILAGEIPGHHGPNILPDRLPPINDIAILGGGITGLTCAYFATLEHPEANITVFESSKRLGGWIRSSEHDVEGGKVIFEQGPRSLRPAKGTLALICGLGLDKFIYYQDRLVPLNMSINNLRKEPLLRSVVRELYDASFKYSDSYFTMKEENVTIGEFFRTRGCLHLADDLISAMIHGIYAGDIDDLSMDSVFPAISLHARYYGRPYNYMKEKLWRIFGWKPILQLENFTRDRIEDYYARSYLEGVRSKDKYLSASIYTLKGGLQTLVTALVEKLSNNQRVKLITGSSAGRIGPLPGMQDKHELELTTWEKREGGQQRTHHKFDRIIATIPGKNLSAICPPLKDILGQSTASTVGVVNLYYKEPALTPVRGFGYLIPKSTPRSSNPEGALGVVFDSDATPELDTAPGTKLTVMLGGPFWKDVRSEQLPTSDQAIEMAKNVVAAHLGIDKQPYLARASVHADCIPQYNLGYRARMIDAYKTMMQGEEAWTQCVRVAGSSYGGGVGVNDCIQNAYWTTQGLNSNYYFGNESGIGFYQSGDTLANQFYRKEV